MGQCPGRGVGPVQEFLSLTAPFLLLSFPEGNFAHGGVGMVASGWEIPAYFLLILFQMPFLWRSLLLNTHCHLL